MSKTIIAVIIIIIITGLGYWFYQSTLTPEGLTEKEQACINSGGQVSTSLCCKSTSDFPNLCLIGPCGCSPDNSHEIKICDCGPDKCFDGNECITIEDETVDWKTYRNEEYGFEIKYPSSWEKAPIYGSGIIVFPKEWKGEYEHPFIAILVRPNPQKLDIRDFYNGVNERNLFSQSNNEYTQGQIAGKPYYKFIPYITFAGEVIVVIELNSAFIEIQDFGAAFQENGIFDAVLSTFRFIEEKADNKEQACIDSGGQVSTSLCCKATGDFPNLCLVGPCGCAPDYSHQVKICDCGPDRCFNGDECVVLENR